MHVITMEVLIRCSFRCMPHALAVSTVVRRKFLGCRIRSAGIGPFGAKILSPNLCRSTCFLQWGVWLACSICKLLQGKLHGNPNHEASEFSQATLERTGRHMPRKFQSFWCLLFASILGLLKTASANPFSGARIPARKIFSGARKMWPNSSKTAERTKKCKSGARKNVFGAHEK